MRRLTGLCVAAGVLAGAASAGAGATASASAVRAGRDFTRPSYAIYTVTVGITGRATQEGHWPCQGSSPCNWGLAGIAKEAYTASFHIDETFKNVILPRGAFSLPQTGAEAMPHVVNGSYSESGQYDQDGQGHLAGFSCGGRLEDSAAEGTAYNLTGHPHGNAWKFDAVLLQYGLKGTLPSGAKGSPCDGQAAFVDGPSSSFGAPTWTASVTLPKSLIGTKSITRTVSGPPARYRPPSDCKDEGVSGGTCTFSLSWHGSIKFKRTH